MSLEVAGSWKFSEVFSNRLCFRTPQGDSLQNNKYLYFTNYTLLIALKRLNRRYLNDYRRTNVDMRFTDFIRYKLFIKYLPRIMET